MTSGKPCTVNLEAFGDTGTIRAEVIGLILVGNTGNYRVMFHKTRKTGSDGLVTIRNGMIQFVPPWAVSFEKEAKP